MKQALTGLMSDVIEIPSSRAPVDALPIDADYITEELKIKAKNELFEDDHTRVEGLKSLRKLLKEEKNLLHQNDDLFLLAFLRARKFNVEKAFRLVKDFYSSMEKRGNIYYTGFDHFQKMMAENTFGILSCRDHESSAIFYFRFSSWNPEDIQAEEHMVCATLGVLQALLSPSTQIAGFQVIADFKGFALKHLIRVTPTILRFFTDIVQNTIPIRVRAIHVVYENTLFSYIFPILKRLLSRKMNERFYVHGKNMEGLHKFIPPTVLPEDLGGELPPFNNSEWRQRMVASRDYLNHLLSFGYEKYLRRDCKSMKRNKVTIKR